MSTYTHVIMRQRLEIEIPDKKYQQEVQRKAHKILEESLNEILGSILSTEVPEDVVISLDELHIDLAEMDQHLLAENIVQKIQHKLPPIVKEQVSLAIQDPLKRRITPLPEAKLKAIKHYLEKGYFAWWMPTNDEKIIEDLYIDIAQQSPAVIKDLWNELGQELPAIHRFLSQFSFRTIQKSINLLSPKYADQILDIAEDFKSLQAVLCKMAHIPPHQKLPTTTSHIVLAHALQTLSTNKKFNEAIFLESCLKQVAQELGTTYSALVTTLVREFPSKHAAKTKLKSNLFNHIIHLHELQLANKHKFKQAATQLPLLIKELDDLFAQRETAIDQRQLANSINQVFEQAENPADKDTLIGYLQSSRHMHRLAQLLSTQDFAKFMRVTQPTIQEAFKITKQLWQSTIQQQNEKSKLVEELTSRYLNKALAKQQGPGTYMNYMLRKLTCYEPNILQKWRTFILKNKAALAETYSPELVNQLLTSLETTQPSPSDLKTDFAKSKQATDDWLTKALHQLQMDDATTLGSPLVDLLNHLYQQITPIVEGKEPMTPVLEKEITTQLNELLQRTISNPEQRSWASTEISSWLHQQADPSHAHNKMRRLETLKKELEATLAKLQPLSFTQIKEFFTDQLLFPGYASQSACMVAVVKYMISLPTRKAEVFTLLQQTPIREQLAKNMEPPARATLIHLLTPLDTAAKETYQQVLLRADILRASTPADKQAVLDEIFLEVTSKNDALSTDHFMQHSLLSFSYKAQLPISEIHRRVCITAQKYAPNTTISNKLQGLTELFGQHNQEVADTLDPAFLPIYQLLTSFIATPSLVAKLYLELVVFLKKTIQLRLPLSAIDKQLQQKIAALFGMLTASQKQTLFEAIKKELEKIALAYEQDLENAWMYFLKTGALQEGYQHPSQLFNRMLGLNVQQIRDATSNQLATNLTTTQLEQLAQKFSTTIETSFTRKRLITSLPTAELEKVVHLIAKENSKTLVEHIHSIQNIWEYAGATTLSHQETKFVWWEAALLNLVQAKKNNNLEKVWLTDSLTSFAKSLAITPYTLVSTLTTATKSFKLSNQTAAEIEKLQELGNQLRGIQQSWENTNREAAQKSWPNEPILQHLHQLLTLGFSSLAGHPETSLEQLEQQLTTLIQQHPVQLKKFFFSYPDPILTSQKVVHYFSTPVIQQIVKTLDAKASPFIQQYLAFNTLPQIDFYNQSKIDSLSWHQYIETASLAYLLKKQDETFNKEKYLAYTFHLIHTYTKQGVQPIVQKLINYHTEDSASSPYAKLAQDLQVLLAQEAIKLEKKFSSDQLAINEPLTDNQLKSVQSQVAEAKQEAKPADTSKGPTKDIKIYVKNSGLIFLWPFLEELFQKQGLLEEQEFIDQIDCNNAVHMLQYLVTESFFTSDWHLTLNKLLCGMPYNEVAFTGYYLREERNFAKIVLEEREEELAAGKLGNTAETDNTVKPDNTAQSDNTQQGEVTITSAFPEEIIQLKKNTEELLKLVLEKWENLKKLEKFEPYEQGFGIQELRQYLLQRPGILQYIEQADHPGYWHLTISWEEQDASINKKLPWPMDKVRLPFMKEDIRVFWLPG